MSHHKKGFKHVKLGIGFAAIGLLLLPSCIAIWHPSRVLAASCNYTCITVSLTGSPPANVAVKASRPKNTCDITPSKDTNLSLKPLNGSKNTYHVDNVEPWTSNSMMGATGPAGSPNACPGLNQFSVTVTNSSGKKLAQSTIQIHNLHGDNTLSIPVSSTPAPPSTTSYAACFYATDTQGNRQPAQLYIAPNSTGAQAPPVMIKNGSNNFSQPQLDSKGCVIFPNVPYGAYQLIADLKSPYYGKAVQVKQDISVKVGNTKEYFVVDANGKVTSSKTDPGSSTNPDSHESNPTCEASADPLTWILCPIYNGVAGFSDWVFAHLVQPLLRTSPVSLDSTDPSFRIWSAFRVYGDIFLVIALLIVIFGQSLGGGLIDAYTTKKVLPRVLAAAILLNLSVYIVAFAVDVTNVIGGSIGAIMTEPLNHAGAFNISLSGVQAGVIVGAPTIFAALGGIGVLVGAIPPMIWILIFLVLPAGLALLAAFVTLILRKAILLALILVSPVAFALYCLPNTEQYFKKWWSLLLKTLMVYPIVIIIFAVADILSVTVMTGNNKQDPIPAIISFLLQFLPLFLIPYAFTIAGGAIGKLHEVLTSSRHKAVEGIKGNPNDPGSLRNQARYKYKTRLNAGASDQLAKLRTTSKGNGSGFRRRVAAGRMRVLQLHDWDLDRSKQNRTFDEHIQGKVSAGADTLERAFFARRWDGPDKTYLDANGQEQTLRHGRYYSTYRNSDGIYGESSEGDVKTAHRMYDGNESQIQTLIKYESGKISNDEDMYGVNSEGKVIYDPSILNADATEGGIDRNRQPLGSFMGNLPTVMRESGLSLTSAQGASTGAFFGMQPQRKEAKHTKVDVDKNGNWSWKQDKHAFVQDVAENVSAYAGANSKTSPIRRLQDIHTELTNKLASGEGLNDTEVRSWNDLQKIARTMDQRIRGYDEKLQAGETPEGQPITRASSGGPGRVNEAIQDFVNQVLPNPQDPPRYITPRPH